MFQHFFLLTFFLHLLPPAAAPSPPCGWPVRATELARGALTHGQDAGQRGRTSSRPPAEARAVCPPAGTSTHGPGLPVVAVGVEGPRQRISPAAGEARGSMPARS
jgi:hypothetical protein